jgi:hypothetical protein
VRPPGNDAITWHAAENAEYLKAYAAKAAFECACGVWDIPNDAHSLSLSGAGQTRPSTAISSRPSPPPTWALVTQS